MRTPLVAGNWKMNGTRASVAELIAGVVQGAETLADVEMLVCPAFMHIGAVADALAGSGRQVGRAEFVGRSGRSIHW